MTIPGIDVVTASTLMAVIGGIRRFPTAPHLVGYLDCIQACASPAAARLVSKEGPAAARHVLVEAAWSAAKSPGPLRAFAHARRRVEAARSPPSPSRASSPCSRGTCSLAA